MYMPPAVLQNNHALVWFEQLTMRHSLPPLPNTQRKSHISPIKVINLSDKSQNTGICKHAFMLWSNKYKMVSPLTTKQCFLDELKPVFITITIYKEIWSPTNQERSTYKEVRCGRTLHLILRWCLTKEIVSRLFTNWIIFPGIFK